MDVALCPSSRRPRRCQAGEEGNVRWEHAVLVIVPAPAAIHDPIHFCPDSTDSRSLLHSAI